MLMYELITGNTYPVKDKLRELGGHWVPSSKSWSVPSERAAEARKLVAEAPVAPRTQQGSHSFRRASCACTEDGCCARGCRCGSECNCRGGPIYDC